MSILTDEDLIEMLQIELLLNEDSNPSPFRDKLLKRYKSIQGWLDNDDIFRMRELFNVVPVKPRFSKCTSCKKSQHTVDFICESCYSICLQLYEG
jgi:hypothetical protein